MSTLLPLGQVSWKKIVLHLKSAEPIGRNASHRQRIYLQIYTGNLLLCPSCDFIGSSFFLVSYRKPSQWTQLFIVLEQTQRITCLQNKNFFFIEPSVSLMISCLSLVEGLLLESVISSSSSSEARYMCLVRLGEFMSFRRLGITLSWN